MLYNSSCTVYRAIEAGFERTFIPECFWQESRGAALSKGAMKGELGVIVYIPEKYAELAPTTAGQDMLVKGECGFIIDNSSDKSISDSLRELRRYKPAAVKTIDDKRYDITVEALRHIKVVAV